MSFRITVKTSRHVAREAGLVSASMLCFCPSGVGSMHQVRRGEFIALFKKYFVSRYWSNFFFTSAQPNTTPIDRTPLKLLRQVPNGKLYLAGSGEDTIYVVHVYGRQGPPSFLPSLNSPRFSTTGDPYDWGVAEGLLLKNEINYVLPNFLIHLEQTIEKAIPGLPDVRLLRLYFRELTPL